MLSTPNLNLGRAVKVESSSSTRNPSQRLLRSIDMLVFRSKLSGLEVSNYVVQHGIEGGGRCI